MLTKLVLDIEKVIALYDYCQRKIEGNVVDIGSYRTLRAICDITGDAILICDARNWSVGNRKLVISVPSELKKDMQKILKEELK